MEIGGDIFCFHNDWGILVQLDRAGMLDGLTAQGMVCPRKKLSLVQLFHIPPNGHISGKSVHNCLSLKSNTTL